MGVILKGALAGEGGTAVFRRGTIIGVIAFLTLVDLFGAQALLPQLVEAYRADPGVMGLAVNASTLGMAVSGLVVAWFADRIDRKRGIWVSLVLLAIPTVALAYTDDIAVFAALRILQGVFMAAAFTLTMTYLAEQCSITAAGGAMAAYITGNVASNLFGRLMAASSADAFGVSDTFLLFAILNLAGAALAFVFIGSKSDSPPARGGPPLAAWKLHASNPRLRSAFVIGFVILFAFVGVFTYVNFELVGPVHKLSPATLGFVYFVFLPAILTTPLAGRTVAAYGPRRVFWGSTGVAILGIALSVVPHLWAVLAGMVLVGAGTFFAQAAVAGYVGRAAKVNHAAANGLYLTSYYVGGLFGALLLGQVYTLAGWVPVAGIIAAALIAACLLAIQLTEDDPAAPAPATGDTAPAAPDPSPAA